MKKWLLNLIKQYDAWCENLGLTPEHKRSCVPYRQDPTTNKAENNNKKRSQ
ncbi:hypothetical protein VHA01S_033_00180 [Vibrio halioticoli NBRC 102217]|uniref:DUF5363 family protein n=1 Tax=Vibrio halioticoli NBRC 102217 TaxID=1219072 RepID=V5FMP7_9VIBR|nr:DUF5363 family protein [Vibrio halioticoli]GAD90117.1 hypothetical protein VHA01S_033_00180 [Vibrio halioticoli NBRC 102217]